MGRDAEMLGFRGWWGDSHESRRVGEASGGGRDYFVSCNVDDDDCDYDD